MLLSHFLGTYSEDTIQALKSQLGVPVLDVVILSSVEEYYSLLSEAFLPETPPESLQVQ